MDYESSQILVAELRGAMFEAVVLLGAILLTQDRENPFTPEGAAKHALAVARQFHKQNKAKP